MVRGPILPTVLPPALPKRPECISLCAPPPAVASTKLARLNTLNAAASNFRLNRSVSLKFLESVRSVDQKPGPTNVLRPKFPRQPKHGGERTGRPVWPPELTPVVGSKPFAQVLRLKFPKWATLLSGRSFLPRVSR